MSEGKNLYIVSYDISSNRIRKKLADTLENYGQRVQYSVFECRLTKKRYKELYSRLVGLCTDENDSVRLYVLCENCSAKIRIIGNSKTSIKQEKVIII